MKAIERILKASALLAALSCAARAGQAPDPIAAAKTFGGDGRRPIQELYTAMDDLAKNGPWTMETVYTDQGLPIRVLHTKKKGPALWLLAGIHGEEPAPPNAVSYSTEALAALAAADIPAVVFPLCNPFGYSKGWRYPDAKERRLGHSVGDSDYRLLDKDGKPRLATPASAQSAALTAKVLELAREYPPALSVDLHEDDSLLAGYIYSQGPKGCDDPVAKAVLGKMAELKYPIKLAGRTDFDEKIVDGVICGVNDGSIDELISAQKVSVDGSVRPGPAGRSVIVVETSSMKMPLPKRVRLHRAIIGMLEELFSIAGKPRPAP
ncbi:MAG: hypothetical protein NTY77_15060 [Elusimicrobia bacterium]|nr:hypothetical protein [Elusimicrobiota bacterium]